MKEPADRKELQNDGDPIREAALPREVVELKGEARLREALIRISQATPTNTNSRTAENMRTWCKAVAECALAEADALAPQPGEAIITWPLVFSYRNHRGEIAERRAHPISVRWGSTEWHSEPQWLMLAFDAGKGAEREFAMRDMGAQPQPDPTTPYTPRVVDYPDGHSEFMLERDVAPGYWYEDAGGVYSVAIGGEPRRFVGARWPTRELPALKSSWKHSVEDLSFMTALEALQIIAGEIQCADNLMSNADVASAALKEMRKPASQPDADETLRMIAARDAASEPKAEATVLLRRYKIMLERGNTFGSRRNDEEIAAEGHRRELKRHDADREAARRHGGWFGGHL